MSNHREKSNEAGFCSNQIISNPIRNGIGCNKSLPYIELFLKMYNIFFYKTMYVTFDDFWMRWQTNFEVAGFFSIYQYAHALLEAKPYKYINCLTFYAIKVILLNVWYFTHYTYFVMILLIIASRVINNSICVGWEL